jgi:hypothetical protein
MCNRNENQPVARVQGESAEAGAATNDHLIEVAPAPPAPIRNEGIVRIEDAVGSVWGQGSRKFNDAFRKQNHLGATVGDKYYSFLNSMSMTAREAYWLKIFDDGLETGQITSLLRAFRNDQMLFRCLELKLAKSSKEPIMDFDGKNISDILDSQKDST